MDRIMRFAGIAALGLAVAACGRGGGGDNANIADADNMLIPADEGGPVGNADEAQALDGNAAEANAGAVGAQ